MKVVVYCDIIGGGRLPVFPVSKLTFMNSAPSFSVPFS